MNAKAFLRLALVVSALAGAPASAEAHLINTSLGDFYGGALHPLTGVEDIIPWFALAILAALQGPETARWLLLTFPLGLAVGAVLSLVAPALTIASVLSIILIAATGLAVAAAMKLPTPVFIGLGTLIALLHGYNNGQAMSPETDHLLFILGLTAIGYVFMTLVTAVALWFLQGGGGWRLIALRASGSWVAAVGIMAVGLHLRNTGMM